jgi:hypothetical protein
LVEHHIKSNEERAKMEVDKENVPCVKRNINDEVPGKANNSMKKMKLSEEEINMNGAPVGSIYDVKVHSDEEIVTCDDVIVLNNSALLTVIKKSVAEASEWIDKYSSIEMTRKALLMPVDTSLYSDDMITSLVQLLLESVMSLRSCIIKNALLCVNIFIQKYCNHINEDLMSVLVTCLFNRMANGPKFIVELAEKIVTDIMNVYISGVSYVLAIKCIKPTLTHKNSDICSKAYAILGSITVSKVSLNHIEHFRDIIDVLSNGLNAKKLNARDACKKALVQLARLVGDLEFNTLVESLGNESKIAQINREVSTMLLSNNSENMGDFSSIFGFDKSQQPIASSKPINKFKASSSMASTSSIRDHIRKNKSNNASINGSVVIINNNSSKDHVIDI